MRRGRVRLASPLPSRLPSPVSSMTVYGPSWRRSVRVPSTVSTTT
ncbi:hypothetical protein ACIQPP_12855 [Streptomyces violaceusniger]|nr:hypothetical protein [Streptomyces hygroscopicus]